MSKPSQQATAVILYALHQVLGQQPPANVLDLSPEDQTLLEQPLTTVLKDDPVRAVFQNLVARNLTLGSISFDRTALDALILQAILNGSGRSLITGLLPLFQAVHQVPVGAASPAGGNAAPPGPAPQQHRRPIVENTFEEDGVVYAIPPAPPAPSIFQSVTSAPISGPVTSLTDNASIVQVFYATDRALASAPDAPPTFAAGRSPDGKLNYGICDVSIPKVHQKGKLEAPSWLRFEFRPDPARHIILASTESEDEDQFFAHVANRVARTVTNEAFVFVHGFNVSFEDAARRTGQIAFDLFFAGAPVFYSWPSNGKTREYHFDEQNVAWSAPHFEQFLLRLHQDSGAKRIHVIAHSMGNRVVCETLKNLSFNPVSGLRFRNLILAAPDMDSGVFGEMASYLSKVCDRITLYQSSKDKALDWSKRFSGNPRAGQPLLVLPGIDTIDASAVDTDFLGHSYFSESVPLLADIHELIGNGTAPPRNSLQPLVDALGPYYSFKASTSS